MKTVGIIAEYNPFHNGHLHQMTQARTEAQADYVIIVMSPDFVQRGEPALLDKWVRARMALEAGADLVLELPVRSAAGSAEFFAAGGVGLLSSLRVADALSFGYEKGSRSPDSISGEGLQADLKVLKDAAEFFLQEETADYKKELHDRLSAGMTYAQARFEAYQKTARVPDPEGILKTPNNILAAEYLKALAALHSDMSVIPVPRSGAGYHDLSLPGAGRAPDGLHISDLKGILAGNPESTGILPSASASGIRSAVLDGKSVEAYMPAETHSLLLEEIRANRYVIPSDLDLLLHDALLRRADHLTDYQDVSTDLANRIRNLLGEYTGFEQFASLVKTRQMTLTRIRRALLHILLGIRTAARPVSYARVLGFRKSAQPLLHRISECSDIPLLTKLPDTLPEGLSEDLRASQLWEMILSHKTGRPLRSEYQRQLVIL